jgi:enoyl-CoA hydratase
MTRPDSADETSWVRLERPAPSVALIRLNRPERRNALSMAVRRRLASAVSAAEDDENVNVIVIAGNDECFASGGDIVENSTIGVIDNIHRGAEKRALWQTLSECTKPIIAAVRGYALGGGAELMMLADIIVTSRTSRIGQPEVRVGIMPGSGGTQRLPRAVGKYVAMHILLTGGWITGERAAKVGLVSEAVEDADVERRALEIACAVASNPLRAVAAVKKATLAGGDASLAAGLCLEAALASRLALGEECRLALAAHATGHGSVDNVLSARP